MPGRFPSGKGQAANKWNGLKRHPSRTFGTRFPGGLTACHPRQLETGPPLCLRAAAMQPKAHGGQDACRNTPKSTAIDHKRGKRWHLEVVGCIPGNAKSQP